MPSAALASCCYCARAFCVISERVLCCGAVWERLAALLRHVMGRLTWCSCKADVALELGLLPQRKCPTPVSLSAIKHCTYVHTTANTRPAPALRVGLLQILDMLTTYLAGSQLCVIACWDAEILPRNLGSHFPAAAVQIRVAPGWYEGAGKVLSWRPQPAAARVTFITASLNTLIATDQSPSA